MHTRGNSPSILSADGSRAAFLVGSDPAHVYVINADGTGLREVDTHPAGDWADVDISANGSVVLSSYGGAGAGGGVARIVNADGSNAHTVFAAGNGKYFRLSADGTKVYFASGGSFDWGGQSHTAGLYVINADGSGLRQIFDRASVHALFGKPVPELQFYWHGPPFDMSDDGSHIVLQVLVPDVGWPIMRVNGDGSDLRAYVLFPNNAHPDVGNLGISGDGRVAFYEVMTDPWELGVFNWDGSGKRVLDAGMGGPNTAGEVVQLTYDGLKLNYGSLNRLYNTDGSGVLQLAATGPTLDGDPPLMVGNYGLFRSSMNRDATRFLFTFDYNTWVNGAVVPEQLGILDLNPASLGQAPSLTAPKIAPSYLVRGDGSTTTFSARMSTANTHLRTNAVSFRNGLQVNGAADVEDAVLYDDGNHGDDGAGDGLFANKVGAQSIAPLGPRTIRMKTEVRGGRRPAPRHRARRGAVRRRHRGAAGHGHLHAHADTDHHSDANAHPDTHAVAHRDGHLHGNADADLDPWRLRRADRGGHGRAHAGLSPAHILHQPARCVPRQAALHPLRRWQPRRLCCEGRSFPRLRYQCGWYGTARGGHASRGLGAGSRHQRRRIEGALLGRCCGVHGQRRRQQPTPGD